MIERNDAVQAMRCTICGEWLEYMRGHMRDPELLMQMEDEFREEHRPCEVFADNPARAKAEREYKRGMKFEMRREQRRTLGRRAPRCNGRIGHGGVR